MGAFHRRVGAQAKIEFQITACVRRALLLEQTSHQAGGDIDNPADVILFTLQARRDALRHACPVNAFGGHQHVGMFLARFESHMASGRVQHAVAVDGQCAFDRLNCSNGCGNLDFDIHLGLDFEFFELPAQFGFDHPEKIEMHAAAFAIVLACGHHVTVVRADMPKLHRLIAFQRLLLRSVNEFLHGLMRDDVASGFA